VASKPTIESEDESDPVIVSEPRVPRPKESDGASTARALWALVDEVKGLSAMRKAELAELKGIRRSLERQRRLLAAQAWISAATQSSLDAIVLGKRYVRTQEAGALAGEEETMVDAMLKEWWDAESESEEGSVESSRLESQLEKGDMDMTLRE